MNGCEMLFTIIAGTVLTITAQAAAATPANAEADTDPMVCQKVPELGSRIRAKRICMRKSEWEAQRRSDKMLIDRSQTQQRLDGGG